MKLPVLLWHVLVAVKYCPIPCHSWVPISAECASAEGEVAQRVFEQSGGRNWTSTFLAYVDRSFPSGFTLFICQVSSRQANSLGSRLEPLKALLPWVGISLGGLGGAEPPGGSRVATLWKGQ